MRTFLVNLDKSTDRLNIARQRAQEAGVGFERFPAVDGRRLSSEEKVRSASLLRQWCAMGRLLTPGEMGCALSHIAVYRKMVTEKIPIAMILEDDVLYLGDVGRASLEVEKFVDLSRPQVFQLVNIVNGEREVVTDRFGCERIDDAMYTSSYVLTLPAAKALIRQNFPVIVPADGWRRWVRNNVIELYQVFPAVFGQLSDTSLISDGGMSRHPSLMKRAIHLSQRIVGILMDRILSLITGR